MPEKLCRRCQRTVQANAAMYDVFEQMHYVCFRYEFEHHGDLDVVCEAGGCPASGTAIPSRWVMTSGVDLATAGDTVIPAILAVEAAGYVVEQGVDRFIATSSGARFSAEDPVALLGLVRLAELRRPWRADDSEIDDVLSRFQL